MHRLRLQQFADIHGQIFGDGEKLGDRGLGIVGAPFRHGGLAHPEVFGEFLVLFLLEGQKRLDAVVHRPVLFHKGKYKQAAQGGKGSKNALNKYIFNFREIYFAGRK